MYLTTNLRHYTRHPHYPSAWNCLPVDLRDHGHSLLTFIQKLKTHLFNLSCLFIHLFSYFILMNYFLTDQHAAAWLIFMFANASSFRDNFFWKAYLIIIIIPPAAFSISATTPDAGLPRSCLKPTTHVRDLGVMIDNDLSLQCHVNHVTWTCFYHLRQLRVICRSLTVDTAHSLVRALVYDLTTVMEFLLVCTNISTTDFNLSCELPLDSFCQFQNGPAFSRPCVTNSTGSLIQKGSSSNYVAPSTSVCTTVHRSTWLNYAMLPGHGHLRLAAYGDLFVPSTTRRLLRPSALVDFCMLAQWPGTVYNLFLRTHLNPLQCLSNCWKQNC